MNTQKFNQIVEAAKAKAAGNARWINAINKAADAILNNRWIITPLAHSYAMTTESGETYFANGSCQCKAYANGQPCKHRCAARILDLMEEEAAPEAVSLEQDVAASSRPALIAEIHNIWPRFAPGLPIEVELMARFKVNRLEMLADDMLKAVRLAIAM